MYLTGSGLNLSIEFIAILTCIGTSQAIDVSGTACRIQEIELENTKQGK